MIDALTGLGYGIISLGVVIGIGIVILVTLSQNIASCPTDFPTWNATSQQCTNATAQVDASLGSRTVNTLSGYLGTGSGGLASWVPIVIVMLIGLLFLGAFAMKQRKTA